VTATIDEMIVLTQNRYKLLQELLQRLSEEQLNSQPFKDRRSIAEIMNHLFFVDGLSNFNKRVFYNSINLFSGVIKRANRKPVDASDYEWRRKDLKDRKSKFISKEKLLKKRTRTYDKLLRNLGKAKDKHRRVLHVTERHSNAHVKQILILENSFIAS
jgi:hypothetical protein